MKDDASNHIRARGLTEKPDRIEYITDVMADLRWVRGKSGKVLAELWGCSIKTVEGYAAEASRLVTADPDEAKRDISAGASKLFREAIVASDAKSAKLMGDLWAMVSGAKAPEKREIELSTQASPAEAARLVREAFGEQASQAAPTESPDAP